MATKTVNDAAAAGDLEARTRLALDANSEIEQLAKAVREMVAPVGGQEAIGGIMGRIAMLTGIMYNAMHLGGPDENIGYRPLEDLKWAFEGNL